MNKDIKEIIDQNLIMFDRLEEPELPLENDVYKDMMYRIIYEKSVVIKNVDEYCYHKNDHKLPDELFAAIQNLMEDLYIFFKMNLKKIRPNYKEQIEKIFVDMNFLDRLEFNKKNAEWLLVNFEFWYMKLMSKQAHEFSLYVLLAYLCAIREMIRR